MKPIRRQKATALLRLDEGLSPATRRCMPGSRRSKSRLWPPGSPKAGLAGVGLDAKPRNLVHLVRPGVGAQKYACPGRPSRNCCTIRATTTNQAVYIDGVMAGETVPLHHGAIVMIVPQSGNGAVNEPWRTTIPSFQDEALFQQYTEILKARRRDPGPDEDEGS